LKTKVQIIESERGWGQKIDETLEFDSPEEAERYTREYNTKHNPPLDEAPGWYMYAYLEGQGMGMLREETGVKQ
jgi:hypothetical protein